MNSLELPSFLVTNTVHLSHKDQYGRYGYAEIRFDSTNVYAKVIMLQEAEITAAHPIVGTFIPSTERKYDKKPNRNPKKAANIALRKYIQVTGARECELLRSVRPDFNKDLYVYIFCNRRLNGSCSYYFTMFENYAEIAFMGEDHSGSLLRNICVPSTYLRPLVELYMAVNAVLIS